MRTVFDTTAVYIARLPLPTIMCLLPARVGMRFETLDSGFELVDGS